MSRDAREFKAFLEFFNLEADIFFISAAVLFLVVAVILFVTVIYFIQMALKRKHAIKIATSKVATSSLFTHLRELRSYFGTGFFSYSLAARPA